MDLNYEIVEKLKAENKLLREVAEKAKAIIEALNNCGGPWLVNKARHELRDALAKLQISMPNSEPIRDQNDRRGPGT
jgi:hypothetical protein